MIIPDAKLIPHTYWLRKDVLQLAQDLLGCYLATKIDGVLSYGRIVEVEAYEGVNDRAAHVYGDKKTARTETMYQTGGHAYVYLCYGIHHLLNVVTATEGTPHAILIRGVEPVFGEEIMAERSNKKIGDQRIGRGPGNVSKALGITRDWDGKVLDGAELSLWRPNHFPKIKMERGARIGVAYAQEDALRANRFWIENNPHVSK